MSVCGGSVVVGAPAETASAPAASSSLTGGKSGSGEWSADFCTRACSASAEGGYLLASTYTERCGENVSTWTKELGEAFAHGVANNPLCLDTLENCMFHDPHPSEATFPLRVEATGLNAYEGKVAHVWADPGKPPVVQAITAIVDGAFALDLSANVGGGLNVVGPNGAPTSTTLVLLYIDVDGDETCKPAVDVTDSGYPEWNGDYLAPAFKRILTPPLLDPNFVCSSVP